MKNIGITRRGGHLSQWRIFAIWLHESRMIWFKIMIWRKFRRNTRGWHWKFQIWNFEIGKWQLFENEQFSPWFNNDPWESIGLKTKKELKFFAVEIDEGMIYKSGLEEGWYGTSDSVLLITKFLACERVSTSMWINSIEWFKVAWPIEWSTMSWSIEWPKKRRIVNWMNA